MSNHQHTVIGLFVLIMAIRLWSSDRIGNAWSALTNGNANVPTPPSTVQQGVGTGVVNATGASA